LGTGATITGWYDGSRGRWSTDHKRRLFDNKHEAKSIRNELRSLCPRNAKVINIEPEQVGELGVVAAPGLISAPSAPSG
jgi:hypothetical protein